MDSRSILVVDDNSALVEFLEVQLTSAGYHVLTAGSGRQAILLARTRKPGLILLDYVLPDLDGADVAQALKSDLATRDIPIVFVTGSMSAEEMRRMGTNIGGPPIIGKPYDTMELLRVIRDSFPVTCPGVE